MDLKGPDIVETTFDPPAAEPAAEVTNAEITAEAADLAATLAETFKPAAKPAPDPEAEPAIFPCPVCAKVYDNKAKLGGHLARSKSCKDKAAALKADKAEPAAEPAADPPPPLVRERPGAGPVAPDKLSPQATEAMRVMGAIVALKPSFIANALCKVHLPPELSKAEADMLDATFEGWQPPPWLAPWLVVGVIFGPRVADHPAVKEWARAKFAPTSPARPAAPARPPAAPAAAPAAAAAPAPAKPAEPAGGDEWPV